MLKRFSVFLLLCCATLFANAQEFRANVTVVATQLTGVDKKIFTTLQNSLKEFINNRHWASDAYSPAERIECNIMLNLTGVVSSDIYRGTLTIQATRPVYNASYVTSLLNIQDNNVLFRYTEFQPMEFNDNRVAGSDPLAANLTAIFAYYAYVMLGLDADSFSPRGGDAFFKKAQNVVNNAPDGKDVSGWKAFESQRNRYWLTDNLLNVKFNNFHDVMYQYHRMGLDLMYDDVNTGRGAIMNCINLLYAIYQDVPNSMLMQTFYSAKGDELLKIFSKAMPQEKARAAEMLAKMDIPNAAKYQQMR
ncbi:protein of unknown function [Chitinophaga jiangningensis]|uniref:DUF4835 domain-containing protein n=1 Tax=Chitinophaga jiangningensis TaxID=1419482 RepID=A0A1M6W541_9BACT|nr:DUF4835 family protein [Chitinophaga jiangningensis]SHK88872.1 protein of unknown function [Chitinophaga jiangningensis]